MTVQFALMALWIEAGFGHFRARADLLTTEREQKKRSDLTARDERGSKEGRKGGMMRCDASKSKKKKEKN